MIEKVSDLGKYKPWAGWSEIRQLYILNEI